MRPEFVDVTADNVEQSGFFCFMSKKNSEGYRRKKRWLEARFAEGMRLRVLRFPDRGVVRMTSGE